MNYGYLGSDDETFSLELEPDDEKNRLSIQLYHFVVHEIDLKGQQVLEVGSGRGGGASFIAKYHRPARLTGVDFAGKAIRFCQKNYQQENLFFLQGNAEALPFDANQFDTVVNVESSHCYGSIPSFLSEVYRVLKRDGYFAFADFRTQEDLTLLEQQFLDAGFLVQTKTEITSNVLEAMKQDNARKLKLIEEVAGNRLNSTLRQFAGIEDSEIFDSFRNGDMVYFHFQLRKQSD